MQYFLFAVVCENQLCVGVCSFVSHGLQGVAPELGARPLSCLSHLLKLPHTHAALSQPQYTQALLAEGSYVQVFACFECTAYIFASLFLFFVLRAVSGYMSGLSHTVELDREWANVVEALTWPSRRST